MQYHVGCRCGKQLAVKSEEAGTTARCECGESVPVPSLSKLRAAVGIGAYESGAIDAIRRMLAEGALPWGETCAVSGRPTADLILVKVQCERLYHVKDRTRSMMLITLLFGFWAVLFLRRGDQDYPHGRDTAVEVPLRVHHEFHRGLSRWWTKRRLRRLIMTVPVYARLLDEYPRAAIAVVGTSAKFDDLDF
jgi:hypothetical protein